MKKHDFTCPHCEKTYKINTYHIGYSDICELRCDSCSATLMLDIYSSNYLNLYKKHSSYDEKFVRDLESMLNPCKCGGTFRLDAPYRCKYCNKQIELADIKRQIDFVGIESGRPGIIITGKAPTKNIWRSGGMK